MRINPIKNYNLLVGKRNIKPVKVFDREYDCVCFTGRAKKLSKKEIQEIEQIRKNGRYSLSEIEPDYLLETMLGYEKFENLPMSEKSIWVYQNQNDINYYNAAIKKEEADLIPKDSSLLRFKYIQDLRNSKSDLDFISGIKNSVYKDKIKYIKDPKILKYLYEENPNFNLGFNIIDAVNSAEGKYTPLRQIGKSRKYNYGEFDVFIKAMTGKSIKEITESGIVNWEILNTIFEHTNGIHIFLEDIGLNIKYYKMADIFTDRHDDDDEIYTYLYENYYLKNIKKDVGATDEQVEKCKEINQKYGTKILLNSDILELDSVLDYISHEFESWKKAGKDEAKFPKIIDFNLIDETWYNTDETDGKGAAAYTQHRKESIYILGTTLNNTKYILRHEMAHLNDGMYNDFRRSEKTMYKIFEDVKGGKYKEEFKKAGISKGLTQYAHTSREEYIAVASDGNTSNYSPEFKDVLCKLGLPEWVFYLKN